MAEEAVWGLWRGTRRIADLIPTEAHPPWQYARVKRLDGFTRCTPALDAALRLAESDDDVDDDWPADYTVILSELRITDPAGEELPVRTIRIDTTTDTAWWSVRSEQ